MGNQLLGSVAGATTTTTGTLLVPSNTSVSVSAVAQILAANTARLMVKVFNNSPDQTLFLGASNAVTTGNGFPVGPKSESDWIACTSALWAAVDGGTVDVRLLEVRSA